MTTCRWIQTLTIAGSLILFAATAWPQTTHHREGAALKNGHSAQAAESDRSLAATLKVGMTRMAASDADLAALVADMNMFTGEMKVDVIARLLTLLVERQSTMRAEMIAIHERMMGTISGPISGASKHRAPDAGPETDLEPDGMCLETHNR